MKKNNVKVIFLLFILGLMFGKETLCQSSNQNESKKLDTLFYQTDEVVVTGTRTTTKIIDVPYSVFRMSNAQYQFEKKAAINTVLNFIPGVFMQSRYGNHDVRISIRGFGSRSNTGIRGVRILLDGIPESEPDGQTRIEAIDFNAVGSIEVVKGNSSSLYTNAPGGVVNFINNVYFPISYAKVFNEYGSFNLKRNGIKIGLRTKDYGLTLTYSYHNYKGFRDHSSDYWNIINTVYETTPTEFSKLEILGYFVAGLIRLPGSLKLAEYLADPFQVAKTEKDYDYRRVSNKGRIGIRYTTLFGKNNSQEVEITTYGTIKYFERAQKTFRIMDRYGFGGSVKYVNNLEFFDRKNQLSFGTDLFYQTGPVAEYNNIAGKKGDLLQNLTDELITNSGFYLQYSFEIIPKTITILLTGRYDKVVFDSKNRLLESQNDIRRFEEFTPKVALNFKLTPSVAIYSSYGLSFDSPAGNELDNYPTSSNSGKLLNPDLEPQKSKNFELGIKGNLIFAENKFFKNVLFDVALFNSNVQNEIVPFEVFGDVFYRNSAKTERTGLEIGFETEMVEGLKLKSAYTLSNFKYMEYSAISVAINLAVTTKNFSGKEVPSVPLHNVNLALSYEKSLIENLMGFIKLSYNHVSGMYVNDSNSEKTKGFNLLSANLGFDYSYQAFNLMLSGGVNNLMDIKYVGFININSTSNRFYEAGEPKSYFGSLNINYNF
jgi:iron complex outermembrane receptor protein